MKHAHSYILLPAEKRNVVISLLLVYIIRTFTWILNATLKLSFKSGAPSILISIKQGKTPEFLVVDESQSYYTDQAKSLGWRL